MSDVAALLGRRPEDCRGLVIAVLGSGGKTSLLRCLAGELERHFDRVLLSTSTKVYPFPGVPMVESLDALDAAWSERRVVFLGRQVADAGKLGGPLFLSLDALRPHADVILLETDGARRHPIKVHLPHDPTVPEGADMAVMVIGASALGRPITPELLHRADWAPPHWKLEPGAALRAEQIVRILIAPDGYLGKAGRTPLRVLVNQADEVPAAAEEIAEALIRRWPGTVFVGAALTGEFRPLDREDVCPSLALLAAGRGERFGSDKRRALLHGVPMLEHCLRIYAGARVFERLLVLGPDDEDFYEPALRHGFKPVVCADPGRGLSESLKSASRAMSRSADSLLVGLADQPALRPETVAQILCDAQCYPGQALRPSYEGQPGHPVFLPRAAFPALEALQGDRGARELLARLATCELDCQDPGCVMDVDTPGDIYALEERMAEGFDLDES